MGKFGYMTVKGNWDRRSTGVFTYAAEYPDTDSDVDIYKKLRTEAQNGRFSHWQKASSSTIVIGSAILPGIIDSKTYSHALIDVESWLHSDHPASNGEALASISDPVSTELLFNGLKNDATKNIDQGPVPTSLGYIAVCNFMLLKKPQ